MMDDRSAFERQLAREVTHMSGPEPPFDALAIARSAITAAPVGRRSVATRLGGGFAVPLQRSRSMVSALKFIVAAAIVALFGGLLLITITPVPRSDEMAPAAVTASPSPMTTDELLSGMVTEEVEPGVFRVDHDGVRDLASADYESVFVGQDGSIWLASRTGHLSGSGSPRPTSGRSVKRTTA